MARSTIAHRALQINNAGEPTSLHPPGDEGSQSAAHLTIPDVPVRGAHIALALEHPLPEQYGKSDWSNDALHPLDNDLPDR
jgi:hypothetical protein